MSGTRVGQGRVYVQLGKPKRIDFGAWCDGLAKGRSYVSDGYAHSLYFAVNGKQAGETLHLQSSGTLILKARVATGPETPPETPYGGVLPSGGRRLIGDTVNLHSGTRQDRRKPLIEVIVNGVPVASQAFPADGVEREATFEVPVDRSCWIALRQFPQMHTNPVFVLMNRQPIRASRRSALWCIGAIRQLWRVRGQNIAAAERDEAKQAFDAAIEIYRNIASECPEGS
jgi:hypothetical protein